jgi:hypothetical protein
MKDKEKKESASPPKLRKENPYQPVPCASNLGDLCKALDKWAKQWEIWGDAVLNELDDLDSEVGQLFKHLGIPRGPGGGPTDATKPPKPPFGGP